MALGHESSRAKCTACSTGLLLWSGPMVHAWDLNHVPE